VPRTEATLAWILQTPAVGLQAAERAADPREFLCAECASVRPVYLTTTYRGSNDPLC